MTIPPYLISAIIFLIVQTTTAVWWASSISSDVAMLKRTGDRQPSARQRSFKARHAKNIAKGKMSAAYWANKTKW